MWQLVNFASRLYKVTYYLGIDKAIMITAIFYLL